MNNKPYTQQLCLALLVGSVLALLAVSVALANGSIDLMNKWAWGTNVGWINFAPDNGGVTVYSDHLEGYAWGENTGWLRLGVCTGGSPCTYTNTTALNYGVKNDGVGNLSGYAWGANVGWINFAPTNGGVWVDAVTGDFSGYAWGENVGWIHFQNTSPAYKVTTGWHGDLTSAYTNTIAAIITTHRTGAASSNGLTISNTTFLQDAGDGVIFGHNNAAFAGGVTTNLPGGVDKRWARIWQLDVNDANANGGNVALTFDISEAGGNAGVADFNPGGTYFLLKRATGDTGNFAVVSGATWSVSGDRLTFTVNAASLGSEFTLGATADSPTAVTMQAFTARSEALPVAGLSLLALMLAVSGLVIMRRRRAH